MTAATPAEQSAFDRETRSSPDGPGARTVDVSSAWNIGENPNGGYLMALLLRAAETEEHPDPVTLTAHFLRPGVSDAEGRIAAERVRRGRTISTWRLRLDQEGRTRVEMLAGFGDRGFGAGGGGVDPGTASADEERMLTIEPPTIAPPDRCVDRRDLPQGVDLAILDRVEVRVPSDQAELGAGSSASMDGWIRFVDGRAPDTLSLPLFADAFPPSLFRLYGSVGWVPTVEMTVQIRQRPVEGWIQASFRCDDLVDGSMVETGELWDESGRLVARFRQLGLLLT